MRHLAMLPAAAALLLASSAEAQTTVQVLSSGSARGVVNELAKQAGVSVHAEFGGGGALRERIEKGETADLFVSADMAQPQKLQAEGRTVVPVIAFAKNRECLVSKKALGVTPANLADKLLDPKVRIKTSQPIADPSGDYTWAIFDKIDAARPGAAKTLKAKGEASWALKADPTVPGQSALAALFAGDRIDAAIVYCSAATDKEVPGLASFPIPPSLDPHPQYGLAVLSNRPEVLRLALYLLSEPGQAIVARNGLVPLVEGTR